MTEMAPENDEHGDEDNPPAAPPPPRRGPGHRGQDVRDTVAEMAARAHEISLEAGSKMAAAMKDVVGAAAGLTAFAIESARDLVNYMVRRGQMTQEEADKLIREAEAAHARNPKAIAPKAEAKKAPEPPKPASAKPSSPSPSALPKPTAVAKPGPKAAKKPATSPVAKTAVPKKTVAAAKAPPKAVAKKAAPKKK